MEFLTNFSISGQGQQTPPLANAGRQSRTSSFRNQDPRNNDQAHDDLSDDEIAPLMRSKSSIILPVRSLSPFREAHKSMVVDSDSSRSTTPELPVTKNDVAEEDEDEVDEEEVDLGKDLFQLKFRKSLLKALSSFSGVQDKGSFGPTANDVDQVAPVVTAEPAKGKQVTVAPKKPKGRKRKPKQAAADVTEAKIIKKEQKTPTKTSIVTRALAAKFTKGAVPNSAYHNLSQTKIHIFKAAEDGDLDVVRELLNFAGPTIRNGKRNHTLLHAASSNGQSDVVLYLLNLISPNIVNKDGQTPAHLAAMNGHTQILKILLADTEFDPEIQDNWQRSFRDLLVSPLFEASLLGDKRKLETLLELGADPDYHAGKLVEGILSRELGVTTARQLAAAIYGERFLRIFSKERKEYVNGLKVTFTRTPKAASRKLNTSLPLTPKLVIV